MKILLLGKDGQLGWELQRSLSLLGELVAPSRHDKTGLCGDLADLPRLLAGVRELGPDVVVNAAAYTAVDKAESDTEQAYLINAQAPQALARLGSEMHYCLIHYSTDYVFDGLGTKAWQEDDPARPLNIYGASKLAGDQAILTSGCQHLIFRTSWVYGLHGNNFIKTILRLAAAHTSLRIVDDQIGAPTGADMLADITTIALRQLISGSTHSGLYHVTAGGETSWYDYARYIIQTAQELGLLAQQGIPAVNAVSSTEYGFTAGRPANSRLATAKLTNAFQLRLPPWQQGVRHMLEALAERGCITP